jgi:hypothetical protein
MPLSLPSPDCLYVFGRGVGLSRCLRSPGHKVSIQFLSQWLPQEEISMIARKLAFVVILGTTSLCWSDAQAHSPYDGSWSVAVYGQSGTCQGGSYQLSLQIVNGNIHYLGGDASVSGRVSSGGAVAVRIETADRSAVGSGRLSRNYGSGTYRGQTQSGACAGTWTGQRTSE